MKAFVLSMCFLCLVVLTHAQNNKKGKISVVINNGQQGPLESATVEIMKSTDSVLVKSSITDKTGKAEVENIQYGSYLLKISMIDFVTRYSGIFTIDQDMVQLPGISLQRRTGEMKEVVVSAKKPFIQKLTDRIVINVDNSVVNAGSSAFDVLERSPGVLIDPNDNISLRGRAGVIIMIDGKITPISGADLIYMLWSMPSNGIEIIHIMITGEILNLIPKRQFPS